MGFLGNALNNDKIGRTKDIVVRAMITVDETR